MTLTADVRPAREGYYVRSVERALTVLRCFGAERPSMTLSEVARATSLDRATARRLLLTLGDLGYVKVDGRSYGLTPLVMQLGYSYLAGLSLVDIARPHLRALADQLGETATLTVLDRGEVVYLDLAVGSRFTAAQIKVGTRFPAHATSMGRVLLAGLNEPELDEYLKGLAHEQRRERSVRSIHDLKSEIRRAADLGWAAVDQELEEDLRGVAVCVRDPSGRVVGAINVSAHAGRRTIGDVADRYVPLIRTTVSKVEAELIGYQG